MSKLTCKDTKLEGVKIITSKIYEDSRGFFRELYNKEDLKEIGITTTFIQDNCSMSSIGVIRGLHYQKKYPQIKLVTCIYGSLLDVVVDIRVGSPTFGKHIMVELHDGDSKSIYIPEGFAHGFRSLNSETVISYKCSDYYVPGDDGGVLWSDPDLNIKWQGFLDPVISEKDKSYDRLCYINEEELPQYKGV